MRRYPPFVAALLSIYHDAPDLRATPAAVGEASMPSANYHLGILCLEQPFLAEGGGAGTAAASAPGRRGRASNVASQQLPSQHVPRT